MRHEDFCFYQIDHSTNTNRMESLCENHSICSMCIESMTYSEIYEKLKCQNCKSNLHTKKKDCPMKECINCYNNSKIISNCENHDICEACLKYPNPKLKNNIYGCKKCERFLEDNCINCLTELNKNDKNVNLKCIYNHSYCFRCFINNSLSHKPNFCYQCKDLLHELLYKDKNVDNQAKSTNSRQYIENNPKTQVSEPTKQLETISDPSKFCKLCETYETNLSCGHLKCMERLKKIFIASVSNFLFQLKACSVPDDAHKKFVIKCYIEECNNLYCFPIYFFRNEGIKLFQGEFKESGNFMYDYYEMIFEGAEYKFLNCHNCRYYIGLSSLYPYCITCNYEYSFESLSTQQLTHS